MDAIEQSLVREAITTRALGALLTGVEEDGGEAARWKLMVELGRREKAESGEGNGAGKRDGRGFTAAETAEGLDALLGGGLE